MSPGSSIRLAAPALALAALLLVPFLDKAFTIDDTTFLREAEHAVADPLHPTAFDMVWFDFPERVAPTSGPVTAWLLVPAVLSPRPEAVAHATQILCLLLALLATVALARRLGLGAPWAAAAGLLLAANPTALAMAGTAMADVPAMAFGVLGVERLVAWKEDRRAHQAALAATWLALAALTRSHLLPLLLVGGAILRDDPGSGDRRPVRWRTFLPLAAAALFVAGALLLTRDRTLGAPGIVGATAGAMAWRKVPPNLVAFATGWVLAAPLAVPWLLLRPRALARRWWLVLAGSAAMYLLLLVAERASVANAVAAGVGGTALADVLADAWSRRDRVQAWLGLWLLLPLAALAYSHLPPKLLLAAAPAAAILVARRAASVGPRLARPVMLAAAVAGLALGVAILRADAAFAGLGRRAASEIVAPAAAAGHRVWFAGHWGFQWYAERAGGRHVTTTPPFPASGDLLVVSRNTYSGLMVIPLIRRDLELAYLGTLEDRRPGGRLVTDGAGFYSNNHGWLPWTWSDGALDAFDLYQVVGSRRAAVP